VVTMRMMLGVMKSATENAMNEGIKHLPFLFLRMRLLACQHGVLTRHCANFNANFRALYVDI